jgi:hypothetical protein
MEKAIGKHHTIRKRSVNFCEAAEEVQDQKRSAISTGSQSSKNIPADLRSQKSRRNEVSRLTILSNPLASLELTANKRALYEEYCTRCGGGKPVLEQPVIAGG